MHLLLSFIIVHTFAHWGSTCLRVADSRTRVVMSVPSQVKVCALGRIVVLPVNSVFLSAHSQSVL